MRESSSGVGGAVDAAALDGSDVRRSGEVASEVSRALRELVLAMAWSDVDDWMEAGLLVAGAKANV